ncbi:MAG: ClpXP protease specificity-enhancing factor [Gammaproteobacteria bacterium]|nr:ClpXP protease specificity-enhancing factor [Gammaproteobacteria bacterium]
MTGHPATRPYLIRAIHEWAVDNNLTPHVLVDATIVGVKVPPGYARGGRITFNIHPQAVKDLSLGNDWLLFSARFGGNSFSVEIPAKAVLAIYARETGRGIFFQGEDDDTAAGRPPAATDGDEPPPPPAKPPSQKKARLKVVK